MKALFLTLLLCASSAFGNEQPQPAVYQDGVLQGFHREPSRGNCARGLPTPESANADGGAAHIMDVAAAGPSSCANEYNIVFTVKSGGATYILTPRGDLDESKCGLLTRAMIPHSVLANQPPQTPIKIRSDGRHFFVKIGNRESVYSVARVE